jgi:hypothetical protein
MKFFLSYNTMTYLKLELNNESVIIKKNNDTNKYMISSTIQWVYLTNFYKGYLVLTLPNDMKVETPVDKKFVYNQDYMLTQDIDFNYMYIYPLGNMNNNSKYYSYPTVPFTGTLDGCHNTIKNLNIINCHYNGLIGVGIFCKIYDLTIQNITIMEGEYCGGLIGMGNGIILHDITINGNMLIQGNICACLASILDGESYNINILIDGIVKGIKYCCVMVNQFNGIMERCNIMCDISNISTGYFNHINGKLYNSSIASVNSMIYPFYEKTNYHVINKSYYIQLNDMPLPKMQHITASYYKNINIMETSDGSSNVADNFDIIPYIDGIQVPCKPFNMEDIIQRCNKMKQQYIEEKNSIELIKDYEKYNNSLRAANLIEMMLKENNPVYNRINDELIDMKEDNNIIT